MWLLLTSVDIEGTKTSVKKAYIFELTPTNLGRFADAASSHTVDCFFPVAFVL